MPSWLAVKSPLHCHAVAFDAGAKIEAATNHKGDSQSERVVSHHRAKHHSIKAASVGGLFLSIARTETPKPHGEPARDHQRSYSPGDNFCIRLCAKVTHLLTRFQ